MIGNDGDSLNAKVTASALPSGAATAGLQAAGNGSLVSIMANVATAVKQDQSKLVLDEIENLIGDLNDLPTTSHDEVPATLMQRVSHLSLDLAAIQDTLAPPSTADLITNKNNTSTSLNNSTFTTLFEYVGSGKLYGCVFLPNRNTVECRIEIDGNIIFDFTGEELRLFCNDDAGYDVYDFFSVDSAGKKLYFKPSTPFNFHTSYKMSARGDNNNRTIQRHLCTHSEDS